MRRRPRRVGARRRYQTRHDAMDDLADDAGHAADDLCRRPDGLARDSRLLARGRALRSGTLDGRAAPRRRLARSRFPRRRLARGRLARGRAARRLRLRTRAPLRRGFFRGRTPLRRFRGGTPRGRSALGCTLRRLRLARFCLGSCLLLPLGCRHVVSPEGLGGWRVHRSGGAPLSIASVAMTSAARRASFRMTSRYGRATGGARIRCKKSNRRVARRDCVDRRCVAA
jgi:hypothetical protein